MKLDDRYALNIPAKRGLPPPEAFWPPRPLKLMAGYDVKVVGCTPPTGCIDQFYYGAWSVNKQLVRRTYKKIAMTFGESTAVADLADQVDWSNGIPTFVLDVRFEEALFSEYIGPRGVAWEWRRRSMLVEDVSPPSLVSTKAVILNSEKGCREVYYFNHVTLFLGFQGKIPLLLSRAACAVISAGRIGSRAVLSSEPANSTSALPKSYEH